MSEYSDQRLHLPGRLKTTAFTVAAVLSLSLGAGSVALAQDATPAATPAATCNAPALPPGSPTAKDATPTVDQMPMGDMATPEAATPEAAAPVGTPADAATGAEIIAAAQAVADCANAGDYEGLVALLTPDMLKSTFGVTNPYDAVEAIKGQMFGNFVATNPVTYADGSVGVDTTYMQTQYQLYGEHWILVKDGDYWKVNAIAPMSASTDLDTSVLGVALAGAKDATTGKMVYSITPATYNADKGESHVKVADALNLHVTNIGDGAVDHELVVLKLPAGADPKGLLDGTISESDVTFVGQVTVKAGQQEDMLLIGLPAGTYTLACFFPDAAGVPHAMNGMLGTLIVDPKS